MTSDQERIADLLLGRVERDKRGRRQRRYLKKDGAEEKEARRALAKVLRTAETLDWGFRDLLAELINPRRDTPRRIVFENHGAGNKSKTDIDRQVAELLWLKGRTRGQMEAAITEAKKEFGLVRFPHNGNLARVETDPRTALPYSRTNYQRDNEEILEGDLVQSIR